jgi:hypothetical protein
MGYLQLNRRYPRGYKGSRIQGFKRNAKELQRVESLAKVIRTLFRYIAEIERMLKALIKSLENKPLNPWTLFSN